MLAYRRYCLLYPLSSVCYMLEASTKVSKYFEACETETLNFDL